MVHVTKVQPCQELHRLLVLVAEHAGEHPSLFFGFWFFVFCVFVRGVWVEDVDVRSAAEGCFRLRACSEGRDDEGTRAGVGKRERAAVTPRDLSRSADELFLNGNTPKKSAKTRSVYS